MARSPHRGRPPAWVLIAALAGSALVVGATLFFVGRKPARRHSPAGIFAEGGARPSGGDPRYDKLLGEKLPGWVVATSRLHVAGSGAELVAARDAAEQDLLASARFDSRLAEGLGRVTREARGLPGSATALGRAVSRINDDFETRGLTYTLDADVTEYDGGRLELTILSYAVESVSLWRAGTHTHRALVVRRLDNLNVTERMLGFVREDARHALILAAKIEEELVQLVLPALAENAAVDLRTEAPGAAELPLVIGAALRKAVTPSPALAALDEHCGRRLAIVRRLGARAIESGLGLLEPTRLFEGDLYRRFASSHGDPGDADALSELEGRISAAAAGPAREDWARLLAQTTRNVERHEVQHRIDAELDALPMPAPLAAIAGEGARIAQHELSAYLAELGDAPAAPLVRLSALAWMLGERSRGPHTNAAVVLFEALARATHAEGVIVEREIDLGRLHALFARLAPLPEAELRTRARAAYQTLFGRALPPATPVR